MDVRPSSFPTEIYEDIIEHIKAGRLLLDVDSSNYRARLATLSACALTCHAWLPTSRVCLYRDVSFTRADVRSLERLVRSLNANPMLRDLVVNLEILDNPTVDVVDLATSTPEAEIPKPHPSSAPQHRRRPPSARPDVLQLWWPMLAGKLPHLQALGLFFGSGLSLRHPHSAAWLRTFSTVTKLSLAWRTSGTYSDLFRILSAFTSLRSLLLVGLEWVAQGVLRVNEVPRRAKLPSIGALTLLLEDNDEGLCMRAMFQELLYSVAPNIETLHVDELVILPRESSLPAEEHTYLEPRMSNLHTVQINASGYPGPQYCESLVAWLSHYHASALEHLIFFYPSLVTIVPVDESLEALDGMAALDGALHGATELRALTRITFVFRWLERGGQASAKARSEQLTGPAAVSAFRVRRLLSLRKGVDVRVFWLSLDANGAYLWTYYTTEDHALHVSYQVPDVLADFRLHFA
ncbi:hypothetical protein C8Q79DRAFT_933925 [Trametes meyenii]|nr:hypothetical protein C8Q79DRAFT_933925 [Trametes meyenii]